MTTFVERVDKLKRDFTDKFVVVDAERPELARFAGYTGRIKTVNMSGRALVEFDEYAANIGWFDIELDYLKVVEGPQPKPEKPAAKKAAPAPKKEKAASPAKPAAGKGGGMADILAAARGGASAPAKPAGKQSTADILAAARTGAKAEAPAKSAPAKGGKLSMADMLAAARGNAPSDGEATAEPAAAASSGSGTAALLEGARRKKAGAEAKAAPAAKPAAAAKPAGGANVPPIGAKLSIAEMIAASRAIDSGEAAAAPAAEPVADEPAPEPEPAAEPEAAAEAEPEPAAEAPAASGGAHEKLTSFADMIAWCRANDGE